MTNEEFQNKYFELIQKFRCNPKKEKTPRDERGMGPALEMILDAKNNNIEITPSDISKKFFVSTARVARLLNQLEKKEYIYRTKSEKDSRKTIIKLTLAGEKFAILAKEKKEKMRDLLLLDITNEEKTEFLRILEKIANNFCKK